MINSLLVEMKKRALLFLVVLLSVNIVSASHNCSSGDIITDSRIIYIGEVKSVNNINIALIMSYWESVAEILLDAKHITLTNTSSSKDIELLSGDYEITLINITGNYAWIDVEGSKKKVEENTLEEAGGLQIYALNLAGTYPGEDANLELFVGSKYIFIYKQNPSSTETISGIEYLIEVPSSSSAEAMISVKKCENGTIIEVDAPVEGVVDDIDNSSLLNDGVQNQSENESSSNGNITPIENITDSDLDSEGENIPQSNILSSLTQNNFYVIAIIIFVILVFVFYFFYKKNKEKENKSSEKLEL